MVTWRVSNLVWPRPVRRDARFASGRVLTSSFSTRIPYRHHDRRNVPETLRGLAVLVPLGGAAEANTREARPGCPSPNVSGRYQFDPKRRRLQPTVCRDPRPAGCAVVWESARLCSDAETAVRCGARLIREVWRHLQGENVWERHCSC